MPILSKMPPPPPEPVEPVEYPVAPLTIINARSAGRCPLTGASFSERAELTPIGEKWVLATPEVVEILTEWPRWAPMWTENLSRLASALAVFRAGIKDPRETVRCATWVSGEQISQHRHRVTQAARSLAEPGVWMDHFEIEGWVALGFSTGWEAESTAPWFMAAGHDLEEARGLLAGGPLTDELRTVLTVEAALAGWEVDGGFIQSAQA